MKKRVVAGVVRAGSKGVEVNRFGVKRPKADDFVTAKTVARLRSAIRKVWSWHGSKKLCLWRATDSDGFGVCEKCKQRVPKLFVDHIVTVGDMDAGYLERMFVSSNGLQALCKSCHSFKSRDERKALKASREEEVIKQRAEAVRNKYGLDD